MPSDELDSEEHWRRIVLFGKVTTCYKLALAKSLLQVASEGNDFVSRRELAVPYYRSICDHLRTADVQAHGPAMNRGTYLMRCRFYNAEEITEEEIIDTTASRDGGFRYVLDRFHYLVGADELTPFFEIGRSGRTGGLFLTDKMFELAEGIQVEALASETEARWNLVEEAWAHKGDLRVPLVYDSSRSLLVRERPGRRVVAILLPALSGYQSGCCFYCDRGIDIVDNEGERQCDVDHFLPFVLMARGFPNDLNHVWNLVLACSRCNRGEGGKRASIAHRRFLQKLSQRNNRFVYSHHPLREAIREETGFRNRQREAFLNQAYENALALSGGGPVWEPPQE
jgi:5-methylcytosine-specific restriction endonuclease McrA